MIFSIPKVLEIEDVRLPIRVERSKRKTMTIQITDQMELLVKVPLRTSEREMYRFIMQKQFWLYKQAKRVLQNNAHRIVRSDAEIRCLREQARSLLAAKSDFYARQLGVCYKRLRIGEQKTRWGSCSSKGTLSYNWKLVLMPEEIQDYVVVHELCHLKELNHSPRFWKLVEDVLPDYALRRAWLKQHGNEY